MNLGSLVATLGVNTAGLTKARAEMAAFSSGVKKEANIINAQMTMMGRSFKNLGRSMRRYVTLPLLAVGAGAFKMQMDFESSMTKIVGLVGVAREQVDQWSKDVIELAPQVAKAPKELADALFFITSAGIRGANAMEVLEMSAKASASGLGETKDVADLVTSAMNAYGPAVLNAEKATDVLTATVREGKAEADALATSMGMVLPIASNLGVSFDQVGAAVAAMTRTGTNAQTASMQLRQILASMLKPTSQAAEQLEKMGTSGQKLRDMLRGEGLMATLTELSNITKEYGEEAMGTVIPNIRALSGVLDIVGANASDNAKIFNSLKDTTGSLDTAFKEASDTAEFDFKQALSTAKATLVTLGETVTKSLAPILNGLTEKLKSVIDWFNNLSEAQRQNTIKIAAVVAAAGPLLMILGSLLTVMGPIGLAITALVGVMGVLAVKTELANDAQYTFIDFMRDTVQWVGKAVRKIKDIIDEVNNLRLLLGLIEKDKITIEIEAVAAGRKEAGSVVEALKEDFEGTDLMNQLAEVAGKYQSQLKSLQAQEHQNIRLITEKKAALLAIIDAFEQVRNEQQTGIDVAKQETVQTQAATRSYEKMAKAVGKASLQLSVYEGVQTNAIVGMEVMKENIDAAKRAVQGLGDASLEWTNLLTNAFQGMANVISDALNSTEGVLKSFWKFFKDFIIGLIMKLVAAAIAAAALAVVLSMLTGGGVSLGGIFKGVSGFKDLFSAGFGAMTGMAQGGIVPPGYNNDSFPARLSSGEAVIPLDRLDSLGPAKVNVVVSPSITAGGDIHWLTQEVERKIGNAYG